MAIVPDFVRLLVIAYLEPLLNWFSEQIYAELLKHAEEHWLVQLQAHLDFAPLESACAGFHHMTGPGAPPTHLVARLVRALLVSYLFSWSLRQLEFHIRFNLVVKWFVGYPLFAAGPDHSTLERFEQWVSEHQHRAIFDEVLRQIDHDCPDERTRAQVGDTFAMRANVAKESLVHLIRHTCRLMLAVLSTAAPECHQRVQGQFHAVALFGPLDEVDDYWLDTAARQQRLQTTVQAALQCAHAIRTELSLTVITEPARSVLLARLAQLNKIIADDMRLRYADDESVTRVTERSKADKGAYRLGSATDPEATYRVHGEKKSDFGYNVSVAVTDHFVREIHADTGAQPDAVGVPELITTQLEHHDLCVEKFIYDAAAGTGKTRATFQAATQGRTQLVAPIPPYGKNASRFIPDDFKLSADGLTLTCPNGHLTDIAYRSGSGDGRLFRFYACAGCPLIPQCRDPKADPEHMRQVFISDYRDLLETARAYNHSDAGQADRKHRTLVERLIANLTRYHGARHARRRGQRNADFQAKMSGVAFNLKQWMRQLARRPQQIE